MDDFEKKEYPDFWDDFEKELFLVITKNSNHIFIKYLSDYKCNLCGIKLYIDYDKFENYPKDYKLKRYKEYSYWYEITYNNKIVTENEFISCEEMQIKKLLE